MKSLPASPLILLLIATVHLACGSLNDPDFRSIENIRLSRFGLKESRLLLDLHYYNPNKAGLKLKKAEGDAWMDDHYLGHFTVDTLIHISALSDFILPVNMEMDMSHLLQNTTAVFLGREVTVKLKGKVRVGKGIVFINYPIRYEGKQNFSELIK